MADGEPEILMPSEDHPTGEFVSQPAKLLRIAAMIRELLEEVRKSSPDEPGRKRLSAIYDKALAMLKEGLSEDLQKELETLTLPLDGSSSESEIRLAQGIPFVGSVPARGSTAFKARVPVVPGATGYRVGINSFRFAMGRSESP